jgi:hypothetical protein
MVERDGAVMKYFEAAEMSSHNRVSSNTSCVFFVLRFYRARLPPTLITLLERVREFKNACQLKRQLY